MGKIKWIAAFFVVGLIMSSPCYGQWAATYGGSGHDNAKLIQQTLDGGFILVGSTDVDYFDFGLWVLKLDSDSTIVWSKTYGLGSLANASSIQQTSDGGYIVAAGQVGTPLVLKLNSD